MTTLQYGTMEIITISDPNDLIFPMSKEIFDDAYVVYHGTGSGFIEKIEKKGWKVGDIPYDTKDFVEVKKYCDEIGFTGSSNRGLPNFSFVIDTQGNIPRNLNPSFTSNYSTARNYSLNIAGESICNLVIAIDEYLEIVLNNKKQNDLKDKLFKTDPYDFFLNHLDGNPEYNDGLSKYMIEKRIPEENQCVEYFEKIKCIEINKMILKITNQKYLSNNAIILKKIKKKYEQYLKSYPVVYVIKSNDVLFPVIEGDITSSKKLGINIPVDFDISPDAILARIDFINGGSIF
ncbi:MAG: hypothetical protein EXR16_04950 [Bacteroidetes bacterium]|nr:hypothetical protein [Bacteroidota bacterium]